MADQSFREIQLGGKQLVFLFMCAVVLTVVVFLLGVSVGRDMRAVGGSGALATQVAAASPAAQTPSAETPPPAVPAPATELNYPKVLQGEDPSKAPPPSPISEEPPAEKPAAEKPAPEKMEKSATAARGHVASPPSPPASAAASSSKPATGAGGWVVQVGAFAGNGVA